MFLVVAGFVGGGQAAPASAAPVTFDLSSQPSPFWYPVINSSVGHMSFANGVMTTSGSAYQELDWPNGEWNATVDNAKGWVIQTRLRVEGGPDNCDARSIWANDKTNLVMFGWGAHEVCLMYPYLAAFSYDTTNGYHTYRFHVLVDDVKVSIDGVQVMDLPGAGGGGGSLLLGFGSAVGGSPTTLSDQVIHWDSFSYDTNIGAPACTIVGTALDDVLYGTSGNDQICAGDGKDTVYGRGGADSIVGGYGADKLHGGGGNDKLYGNAGADQLFGEAGADSLVGGQGVDVCDGGVDTVIDTATGCETVRRVP